MSYELMKFVPNKAVIWTESGYVAFEENNKPKTMKIKKIDKKEPWGYSIK